MIDGFVYSLCYGLVQCFDIRRVMFIVNGTMIALLLFIGLVTLREASSFSNRIDFGVLSRLCHAELDSDGPFGLIDPREFIQKRSVHGRSSPSFLEGLRELRERSQDFDVAPDVYEPDFRFDWQERGAVSPIVHDQGSLGTCAAFAATGNIEGQRYLYGDGVLESLSVEQIIECSAEHDDSADEADCGVFGGWPRLALEHVQARGGIASEKDWPYCSGTLSPHLVPACFPCMPKDYSREGCDDHDDDFFCDAETTIGQRKDHGWCFNNKEFRPRVSINEVLMLEDPEGDEERLKQHLEEHGPLAVTISIGPLQFYRKGILDPPPLLCPRQGRPDHVVLLVGYGVAGGVPFWRLKNSWGVAWGENGYFRLRRGKNSCGIGRFQVVTAKGIHVHPQNQHESQQAEDAFSTTV